MDYNPLLFNKCHRFISLHFCFVLCAFQLITELQETIFCVYTSNIFCISITQIHLNLFKFRIDIFLKKQFSSINSA